MRKQIYFLAIFILFSCNDSEEVISPEQMAIDSLSTVLKVKDNTIQTLEEGIESSDSLVNQYALYIKTIRDNITEIEKQELFLKNLKGGSESYEIDSMDVITTIKNMGERLKENEKMIYALNHSLEGANSKNNKFMEEINSLNELIAKNNREVYLLQEELSAINTSFDMLFDKYNSQNIRINELSTALNKVAYAIGSKGELLDNGVLTKQGGVIGIGKTKKLSNDLNTEYFTYASKNDLKVLQLGVKNIKIITSHSSSSYEIHQSEKGFVDSLVITNPDLFWRNSKFLVVEVK